MKKIILLDIDGVLAPLGRVNEEFTVVNLDGWSIVAIPNNNIDFIKNISRLVEIVWSSSWENTSNNICDKANLANFSFLQFHNTQQNHWNKLSALVEFIEKNYDVDILILDDDIDLRSRQILNKYDNVSIVDIEPVYGLTIKDKADVLKWIKECKRDG